MNRTVFLLTIMFCFANAADSNAAVISTSVRSNVLSGVGNLNQTLSIALVLSGNEEVGQFAFTARVTRQSGNPLGLVPTTSILSPNVTPANAGFGQEFGHSINGTSSGTNLITFSGTLAPGLSPTSLSAAGGPRERIIDFEIVRGVVNDNIQIEFAAATIPTTVLDGFRSSLGAFVPVNQFAPGGALNAFGSPVTVAGITAVPEPSSIAMLAVAGIFGLGIRMRNWKSKRQSAS